MNEDVIFLPRNLFKTKSWARKPYALKLFICLLFDAFQSAEKWDNIIVERGSLVINKKMYAEEYRLTDKQLAAGIACLKKHGEITTRRVAQKYILITVCNYEVYKTMKED